MESNAKHFSCCRETPTQGNHRHVCHKVSGLHVSGFAVGSGSDRVSEPFDVLRGGEAEAGIPAKGGAEVSRMPVLSQSVCQGKVTVESFDEFLHE